MDLKELAWTLAIDCMLGYAEETLEMDENANFSYYFPSRVQLIECIIPDLIEEIVASLGITDEEAEELAVAIANEIDYNQLESYASHIMSEVLDELFESKLFEQVIDKQIEAIIHLFSTQQNE